MQHDSERVTRLGNTYIIKVGLGVKPGLKSNYSDVERRPPNCCAAHQAQCLLPTRYCLGHLSSDLRTWKRIQKAVNEFTKL